MYRIFIVGGRVFFCCLSGRVYMVVGEFVPANFFSSYFYCKIVFLGSKAEKTAAPGEKEEKS